MKRTALWLVLLAAVGVSLWLLFGRGNNFTHTNEEMIKGAPKKAKSTTAIPQRDAPPIETENFDNDPIGSLSMDGQVLNENGEPVVGAQISISTIPLRVTTSGEKGVFSFDGLNRRNYYLIARTNDKIGETNAQPTEDGVPVIITIKKGKSLRITVLDARDRHPIEGAKVYTIIQTTTEAKTNQQGVVEFHALPRWSTRVIVFADGYAVTSEFYFISKELLETTILMYPGIPVSGQVLDPNGKPIAGAEISANPLSNGGSALNWLPDELSIRSDNDGNWSIPGVSAGAYVFRATHPEYAPGESASTTIKDQTPVTGIVLQLKQGSTLAGTVVDTNETPVAGAQVSIFFENDQWLSRSAFSDANGSFSIKGLPKESFYVSAKTADSTSESIFVDMKKSNENLLLQLKNTGTIEGIVVSTNGTPLEKAHIQASTVGNDKKTLFAAYQFMFTETDIDGKFVLRGVPDGVEFRVVAQRSQLTYSSIPGRDDIRAKAGDHSLRFVLTEAGKMKGHVAFADGSVPPEYEVSINLFNSQIFRNEDGSFSAEYEAAGPAVLIVQGETFLTKRQPITLKEGTEVDAGLIELDAGRSIRGIVVDEEGKPISGASVAVSRRYGEMSSSSRSPFSDGKRSFSGADGRFRLSALPATSAFLFAEHLSYGRSEPLTLPNEESADTEYKIVLKKTGTIEGTVTYKGAPVVSGVSAHYQIKSFHDGGFFANSGTDGFYRFERLSAGTYYIDAERTDEKNPEASLGQKTTTVIVKPGETTRLDIEIPSGVTLNVSTNKTNIIQWTVSLVASSAQIKNEEELQKIIRTLPFDKARQLVSYNGDNPAVTTLRFEATPPGNYTICAEFVYKDLRTETNPLEQRPKEFTCRPIQITASPEEQSVSLQGSDK